MRVRFFQTRGDRQEFVGALVMKRKRIAVEAASKENRRRLTRILKTPVLDFEKWEPVHSADDPIRFLKFLPFEYKTIYFWAELDKEEEKTVGEGQR